MTRHWLCLLALGASAASAAEVTVIRPRSYISNESSYFVFLDDQKRPVSELQNGERVTLRCTLAIQCPKGLGANYDETRLDFDFKASARAFFVLTPQPTCVLIEAVDAATAAPLIRQTRPRLTGRLIEYDQPAVSAQAKGIVASSAAVAAVESAARDQITAATAAWAEAFNSRDPARMSALYDAEAVLTDAGEARPRIGGAAIGDYYQNVTRRPTQRVALGERNVRVLGDTAIDSGTLTYFEMRDGNATTTPGRYSVTYQRCGGKWLIVDHHLSAR